ncbi:hypothetical protein HK405_007367, partial [Cladochytrium tenue]
LQGVRPVPDTTRGEAAEQGEGTVDDACETKVAEADELKMQGVEAMKVATRRYARKQVAWIRNKLGPRCARGFVGEPSLGFYALDCSDVDSWTTEVQDAGISLAKEFLAAAVAPAPTPLALQLIPGLASAGDGTTADEPPTAAASGAATQVSAGGDWTLRECHVCSDSRTGRPPRLLHGAHEWAVHAASSKHRRRVRGAAERAARALAFARYAGSPVAEAVDEAAAGAAASAGTETDDGEGR